jgi:hypothetical protein
MKKVVFGLFVLMLSASPGWAAGLKLVFSDGTVSVDAQDVTIRQILTEWSRLGKTRIVNLERVTSGPVTLKLENVPENVALDTILRAVPGYMAAPRSEYLANASVYDRILIMATTTAVAARPGTPSAFQPPNAFPPAQSPNITQLRGPGSLTPGVLPEPADVQDPQDDPAIAAAAAAGLITVPAPNGGATFTGMRPLVDPNAPPPAARAPTPSNPWNVPVGASRPGLAPPPPPPAATPATGIRRPPQADR